MKMNKEYLEKSLSIIKLALEEDIGAGDITTNAIVPDGKVAKAKIVAKENGVLCGLDVARKVFELAGGGVTWKTYTKDGSLIKTGEIIAQLEGNAKALLKSERTALNFLQRLSGIATKTRNFVEKIKGTKTKLLDSRKTAPGLRALDKYAVKIGGGENHRFGLYDMVLIKENHILIAGTIAKAIRLVKNTYGNKYKVEVEVNNFDDLIIALGEKPDIIMLDNMNVDEIKRALRIIDGRVLTEASGNVNINTIREIANAGVDFISVGELTHSVKALDISMLFY